MKTLKFFLIQISIIQCLMLNAQSVYLSNNNYSSPLFYSNLDSLVINNCNFSGFSGEAIRFDNVDYVIILNSNFSNISNTNSTKATICGRKSISVELKNLNFSNIGGTVIRFPSDGESNIANRLGKITIDSVSINGNFDPSTLESNAIRIFHSDSVFISNCTLSRIHDNAISLGRNSSGQTQNDQRIVYAEIFNNSIDSVLGNGIVSSENAGNCKVYRNVISNIAYDGIGMLYADGDHGIYWQAPGAEIYQNHIFDVLDGRLSGNRGVGISLRTNARVYQNKVSDCTLNGIAYWNDHPGSGLLEITNNLVYGTFNNGIYVNGSGPNTNKADTVYIFHNSVHNAYDSGIIHQFSPIAINNMSSYNLIAGNLLLFENVTNPSDFIRFLGTTPSRDSIQNYLANINDGFEDISTGDYRLTASNPAINYVNVTGFIGSDLDNNQRIAPNDAGCYEFLAPSTVESISDNGFSVFPNPFRDFIEINSEAEFEITGIIIYDLEGRKIVVVDNSKNNSLSIDLTNLAPGMFVLHAIGPQKRTIRRIVKI